MVKTANNKCEITGYAGVKAGSLHLQGMHNQVVAGANAGVNFKAGVFVANAEATAGTALQGKIKVGMETPLSRNNDNWKVNCSLNASATQSLLKKQ